MHIIAFISTQALNLCQTPPFIVSFLFEKWSMKSDLAGAKGPVVREVIERTSLCALENVPAIIARVEPRVCALVSAHCCSLIHTQPNRGQAGVQ